MNNIRNYIRYRKEIESLSEDYVFFFRYRHFFLTNDAVICYKSSSNAVLFA
ncbi:hypothetical protein JCM10003_3288 [Bacteroides pyogenes JCM 10003]|uniref:Uncharacterized protein n=2 Tax=Bacteroides pyogenes TaxID=310300 RepID=W4PJV9_9BACE|nr:hypothetical protein JCM6292_3124 [Bacteroides pyogenes JCM 6292]GAE19985.1 hypothetical protein JCM6294_3110 [Bacteroides pyogenes DSM 20611 = JCM 6294]GAE23508.1 hypothetical protein JCM10003_3288 [Bacteroides pyogenes JCM 10003]